MMSACPEMTSDCDPDDFHPRELAVVQHRGLIARQQQDAVLAGGEVAQKADLSPYSESIAPRAGVCAVADGVAVSFKPQLASKTLLEVLRVLPSELAERDASGLSRELQDGWIGPRALRRYIHPHLCRRLSMRSSFNRSATTLALLQWREGRFSALNVGDSRIYCISADGEWCQVSLDHTYYQSMVQRGELAPGDDVGQLYHDLEHMISSDESEDDFAIHWQSGVWPAGSTWLLCTDGLHDSLNPSEMQALFAPDATLVDLAGRYRQAVLEAGAPDNVSFILLR